MLNVPMRFDKKNTTTFLDLNVSLENNKLISDLHINPAQ